MTARVVAVSRSLASDIHKANADGIRLIDDLGVEGDRHCGPTMRNMNRFRGPRLLPNIRQVHLMSIELQAAYREVGHAIRPGEMGENITTEGIDLLALPTGAILHVGGEAAIALTGFRPPCFKLDKWQSGLKAVCLDVGPNGESRRPGVMGVVRSGGMVRPGDVIRIELPAAPHQPLKAV